MKERLKQLRKLLGIKQRELAERLGIGVGNVGDWESGLKNVPRARIYQICKEYNVRQEWLVDGVGDVFEPEPEPIDVKSAQRRFVLDCFRALPSETQEVFLDALKKYVDETTPEPEQQTTPQPEVGAVLVAFNDTGGRGDEATA